MTKEQFTLHLIRSLILEYRISLDTINQLGLVKDAYNLYDKIIDVNDLYVKGALIYVLNYDSKGALVNEKEAKINTLKFLSKFSKLKTTKEKVLLVNQLNDNTTINEIKKKNGRFSKNDIISILKYRYKYCLSKKEISKMFNVFLRTVDNWEESLDDENLKNQLKALNDFKRITEYTGIKSKWLEMGVTMTKEQFTLHLVRSLILEYRLSLETLEQLGLIKNNPKTYNQILEVENDALRHALTYILDYETKGTFIDQKEAKINALKFLRDFSGTKSNKEKIELVNNLNNNLGIHEIKNKTRDQITPEEVKNIVRYRYKYCLTKRDTISMFDLPLRTLRTCEENFKDEVLKSRLEVLNDYYASFYDADKYAKFR